MRLQQQEGKGKLRMQVDVGASVMMQAEAPSVSMLLIDVGLGFRVECDLAEAQEIASLHVSTAKVSFPFALLHFHNQELWAPCRALICRSGTPAIIKFGHILPIHFCSVQADMARSAE